MQGKTIAKNMIYVDSFFIVTNILYVKFYVWKDVTTFIQSYSTDSIKNDFHFLLNIFCYFIEVLIYRYLFFVYGISIKFSKFIYLFGIMK